MFNCKICGKEYNSLSSLFNHFRQAHKDQDVLEEPEAKVKDNYKCKYRKRDGIVEFSLNEVETDKDALREFVKWFSTQQDFLLGELFKNDKKIRQIRRQ